MAFIGTVEVLSNKTIEKFGYDPDTLSFGSHKRIVVKCNNCNEEFLRERKALKNLHKCPTFINLGGKDYKWCNRCEKYLDFKNFHKFKSRKHGLDAYCKECVNNGSHSRKNNLNKWISYICSMKKFKSGIKGVPFNLSTDILHSIWERQGGRCFYSKVELTIGRKQLNSASLERIDPSSGYVESNVVWAAKAMNYMKNSYSYSDFVSFLTNMDVSSHIMVRCESRLIHEDAQLPARSKSQDAGLDIGSVEDIVIKPKETINISTGVILTAPPGYYFTIEGRSGLFRKGIFPLRGIIDASYIGEMNVSLFNSSDVEYEVKSGDRIAQLILHRVYTPDVVMVDNFSAEYNQRGINGYGSTGR